MIDEQKLKEVVAAMLMIPAGDIRPETSLAGLDNSLGEAKLRLALKRFGGELPNGVRPAAFGALDQLLRGTREPEPSAPPVLELPGGAHGVPQNGLQELRIGLDVQDVASLPVCADYWEHEFYRGTFAKSEIAYAIVQQQPRVHFAGFWCAKEALRKCDANFRKIPPPETAVAHDETGRPYLVWMSTAGDVYLSHAVSISHAGNLAMAVVAAGPALDVRPVAPAAQQNAAMGQSDKHRHPLKPRILAVFLVIALSVAYLLVRFLR